LPTSWDKCDATPLSVVRGLCFAVRGPWSVLRCPWSVVRCPRGVWSIRQRRWINALGNDALNAKHTPEYSVNSLLPFYSLYSYIVLFGSQKVVIASF